MISSAKSGTAPSVRKRRLWVSLALNPGYSSSLAMMTLLPEGKMAGGNLAKLPVGDGRRDRWRIWPAACAVIWLGATLAVSAFAQDAAQLAAGEAAWDTAGCL